MKLNQLNQFSEFNAFDIAIALYHWLQHNWNGQGDSKYLAFCELTKPGMFRIAPSLQLYRNLESNEPDAFEVYHLLNESNYTDALKLVINYESENM